MQFLGEAILLTFIALLLAAIMVEILLPLFNNFTGKEIDTGIVIKPLSLLLGLGLLLFVGLLSGSYPAFFLSSQNTSHLKDTLSTGGGRGVARKALVVVQFLISIALIIGTISAYAQLNFLRNG